METLLGFKISDWGLTLCSEFFFLVGKRRGKILEGTFLGGVLYRDNVQIFCSLST